ncbi:hypothetical protein GCK32_020225 [Trichostrongylus colubriformis]|uniref:Uncharacterized protein n=1 Tax=Trichostrongylus colubriformis TaxID=6319 RepID=A0AAN8J3C6_TRICO
MTKMRASKAAMPLQQCCDNNGLLIFLWCTHSVTGAEVVEGNQKQGLTVLTNSQQAMCFQRKGVTPVSERSTRKKASSRPVGDGSAKQTFKKEQGVYVLTEKNFDAFVDTHPTFLAEFHAPT